MIQTVVLNDANFKTYVFTKLDPMLPDLIYSFLSWLIFPSIMHHIHKLKSHRYIVPIPAMWIQQLVLTLCSSVMASKALEDLIDMRLFREEKQIWIEKVVITRIWVGTSNNSAEYPIEKIHEFLDSVLANSKVPLSPSATHAAQTVSSNDRTTLPTFSE